MTLKNKILKLFGRKEVNWYREYGVLAPFCPYCSEPAYDTHRCVFCGEKYIWREFTHPTDNSRIRRLYGGSDR